MRINNMQINFLIILVFTPTTFYCAQQKNNPIVDIIQKTFLDAYNSAAPIIYNASTRLLLSSNEFIQTNIESLFSNKKPIINSNIHLHNKPEEFEEINPSINYEKFIQMAETGALKQLLQNDPATAIGYINNITRDKFKEKNIENISHQEQISRMFSIVNQISLETNIEFELAKALAQAYNQLQEPILNNLIQNHANQVEPILKKHRETTIQQTKDHCKQMIQQSTEKRDKTIQNAHSLYEQEINQANTLSEQKIQQAQQYYNNEIDKHRKYAAIVAFNKYYLHQKSGTTHNNINLDDYTTIEKYLILLSTLQQNKSND